MKFHHITLSGIAAAMIFGLSSCANLDLNPLTEPSSETWNSTLDEVRISLNDMYRESFYELETNWFSDRRTDDWAQRDKMYDLAAGQISSSTNWIKTAWKNTYKAISRCNRIIEALDKLGAESDEAKTLRGETRMFRAFFYARLITLWGDVPYYTTSITIEEARELGRTPKREILEKIYEDYDAAIALLPVDNVVSGVWRVNRGVALALKTRIALTMQDWALARDAAKACMKLGKYELAPDYGALFRDKSMDNGEFIFAIARSVELGQSTTIKSFIMRTAGGNATAQPSWDLLAAYECTDGKPIDESPLFDPANPYLNRDPRCCETFVAPGTEVYGTVFDPSPMTEKVMCGGVMVTNKENKVKDKYAAYCSTCLRKGAQEDWRGGLMENDNPSVIIRYADVLLMYAEAKVELGELDDDMLNAINDVRARAYHTTRDDVAHYPALAMADQNTMRLAIRRERRVELAWEGIRFFDLLRWDWMKKALSHDYYGHGNGNDMKAKYKEGKYYWPATPEIDEEGFADFKPMFDAGDITRWGVRVYDERLPLLPLPFEDVDTSNGKIQNNPGW